MEFSTAFPGKMRPELCFQISSGEQGFEKDREHSKSRHRDRSQRCSFVLSKLQQQQQTLRFFWRHLHHQRQDKFLSINKCPIVFPNLTCISSHESQPEVVTFEGFGIRQIFVFLQLSFEIIYQVLIRPRFLWFFTFIFL